MINTSRIGQTPVSPRLIHEAQQHQAHATTTPMLH